MGNREGGIGIGMLPGEILGGLGWKGRRMRALEENPPPPQKKLPSSHLFNPAATYAGSLSSRVPDPRVWRRSSAALLALSELFGFVIALLGGVGLIVNTNRICKGGGKKGQCGACGRRKSVRGGEEEA